MIDYVVCNLIKLIFLMNINCTFTVLKLKLVSERINYIKTIIKYFLALLPPDRDLEVQTGSYRF